MLLIGHRRGRPPNSSAHHRRLPNLALHSNTRIFSHSHFDASLRNRVNCYTVSESVFPATQNINTCFHNILTQTIVNRFESECRIRESAASNLRNSDDHVFMESLLNYVRGRVTSDSACLPLYSQLNWDISQNSWKHLSEILTARKYVNTQILNSVNNGNINLNFEQCLASKSISFSKFLKWNSFMTLSESFHGVTHNVQLNVYDVLCYLNNLPSSFLYKVQKSVTEHTQQLHSNSDSDVSHSAYTLRYYIMFYICRTVLLTICVNVALVNLIILVNYYTYPDVDSKHVNILRVCRQLCCYAYRKHIETFGMLLSLYNMGLISIYVIVILFGKHELFGDKVASECCSRDIISLGSFSRSCDHRSCARPHAPSSYCQFPSVCDHTRTFDQGMCHRCYACTFTGHVITHPSSTHTSPCHPYTTLNRSEGEDKYKNQLYLLPKAFEAVSHLLAYLVTGSFSQVPFAKSLVNPCYKAPMSLDLDASGTKLTDWIAPNRAVYHNEWIVMTALADETEPSNAIDAEEKDPTSADSDEIFSDSHAWLEDDTPKQPAELATMSAPTPSGTPKKKNPLRRRLRSEMFTSLFDQRDTEDNDDKSKHHASLYIPSSLPNHLTMSPYLKPQEKLARRIRTFSEQSNSSQPSYTDKKKKTTQNQKLIHKDGSYFLDRAKSCSFHFMDDFLTKPQAESLLNETCSLIKKENHLNRKKLSIEFENFGTNLDPSFKLHVDEETAGNYNELINYNAKKLNKSPKNLFELDVAFEKIILKRFENGK